MWPRGADVPRIVLVTDPGPDPDDVKVLLVLGVLHKLGRISLLAVVANGGGQACRRAALARCILDHLAVFDVPVGIGSEGERSVPQAHEFDLAGVAEAEARLESGHALLLRTIRAAPPRSVRVVLISSLRDFADLIATDANAVLMSVHTVAIQGGLVADVSRPSGWRADSSVNNGFDMEAAETVYAFCFDQGLPMTVTSRFAVPLLPMQLARSFAERTNCPLMAYLAAAQSLGLEGLWQKLCLGALPSRCNKQWYFETFCGVDATLFAQRGYEELGMDANIAHYLNGYIKPYDICALMTVLPFCQPTFDTLGFRLPVSQNGSGSPSAQPALRLLPWVAVQPSHAAQLPPKHHLLLLSAQDELPQAHVLNLLRDTYHEVVLATREQAAPATHHPAGLLAVALGSISPAFRDRCKAARASQAFVGSELPLEGSLRGNFGAAHRVRSNELLRSNDSTVRVAMGAQRGAQRAIAAVVPVRSLALEASEAEEGAGVRSRGLAVLPMEAPALVQLLDDAFESARAQKRAIQQVATALALSFTLIAFVAGALDQTLTLIRSRPGITREELYDENDAYAFRIHCSILIGGFGMCAMVLSLAPGQADRNRAWLVSFVLAAVIITLGSWQYLPMLIKTLHAPYFQRYKDLTAADLSALSPVGWDAAWTAYYMLRTLNYVVLWVLGALLIWRVRHSTRMVARTLCCLHGMTLVLKGLIDMYSIALGLSSNLPRASWFWPCEGVQAVLSMAFGTYVLLPATRATTQIIFARIGTRNVQSRPETALAAILGYGAGIDEREPAGLVAAALQCFEPIELSLASLREMGVVLFAPSDELIKASVHWRVCDGCPPSRQGSKWRGKESAPSAEKVHVTADIYVVHSAADDAGRKLEALCDWVGRFEAKHARPPRVWLNSLCVDSSLSHLELLEHMPAYLARSERLLLLVGSRGVTHLWNAAELYVYRALGGELDNIEVAIVEATPASSRRHPVHHSGAARTRSGSSVVSAFDTFHAMLLSADEECEVRSRLLYAVELVSVGYFNLVVREILPRARLAAASTAATQD